MCTLTSCCAETSASCAELISCPGEEDDAEEFVYETVPEFVTAVEEMSPTALVELLEHHPRRVAYHAPRNSVVLTGCSGVVKALLPITADQLAAVVAADL